MGGAASAGGSWLCRWEGGGPSGRNVPPRVSGHPWAHPKALRWEGARCPAVKGGEGDDIGDGGSRPSGGALSEGGQTSGHGAGQIPVPPALSHGGRGQEGREDRALVRPPLPRPQPLLKEPEPHLAGAPALKERPHLRASLWGGLGAHPAQSSVWTSGTADPLTAATGATQMAPLKLMFKTTSHPRPGSRGTSHPSPGARQSRQDLEPRAGSRVFTSKTEAEQRLRLGFGTRELPAPRCQAPRGSRCLPPPRA